MILLLANLRTGLASMVPNLSPIIVTLGLMGWTGIDLYLNMTGLGEDGMAQATETVKLSLLDQFRQEQLYRRLGSSCVGLFAIGLSLTKFRLGKFPLFSTGLLLLSGPTLIFFNWYDPDLEYHFLRINTLVQSRVPSRNIQAPALARIEDFNRGTTLTFGSTTYNDETQYHRRWLRTVVELRNLQ